MKLLIPLTPIALMLTGGCADVGDSEDGHNHNHGVVTAVVLHFSPLDGGDVLTYTWSDAEDSANPTVDDIVLPDASDHPHHDAREYGLEVEVYNELEDPVEDVTPEIADLANEHQFFFTGSAVEGPATGSNSDAILEHTYADADGGGLPVGMENTISTLDWGTGDLVVTLRHLPAEDGNPVKVAGLADEVADNGFGSIGGGNDIQVTFPITVE